MAALTEKLTNALLQLSARDRAEVAYLLIRSLDNEEDADAEAEWDAELTRRWEEITSGVAKGRPFEEVIAALREKYA
jgi:putative addiction module component (TIGR02574 family)